MTTQQDSKELFSNVLNTNVTSRAKARVGWEN